ncbi:MAG: hypothetical protein U9Q67_02045 [Patescibacteria group bacterium]|nr:hypothetical protein [Patescibacteria group bacterium]
MIKKKTILLVVGILMFGLVLCIGGGVVTWLLLRDSDGSDDSDEVSDSIEDVEDAEDVEPDEEEDDQNDELPQFGNSQALGFSKIAYMKYSVGGGEVYVSGSDGSDEIMVASYEDNIEGLSFINEDYLGYFVCNVVVGDFACEFYVTEVNGGGTVSLYRAPADQMVYNVAFLSENELVYITEEGSMGDWVIFKVEDSVVSEYYRFDVAGIAYGRGGFLGDSAKMAFSSDGKYFYDIETGSPRGSDPSMDFNIYVFEYLTGALQIVPKATHPTWISSTEIMYSDTESNQLAMYDVESSITDPWPGISDVWSPSISPDGNLFMYWKDDGAGEIVVRKSDDLEIVNEIEAGTYPKWVGSNKLIYTMREYCGSPGCGGPGGGDYMDSTAYMYDLNVEESIVLHDDMFSEYRQYQTLDSKY